MICSKCGKEVMEMFTNTKRCFVCEFDSLMEENARLREIIKCQDNTIKRLQACHDAELGVCQEHCDEVKKLREIVRKLVAEAKTVVSETGWYGQDIEKILKEAEGI